MVISSEEDNGRSAPRQRGGGEQQLLQVAKQVPKLEFGCSMVEHARARPDATASAAAADIAAHTTARDQAQESHRHLRVDLVRVQGDMDFEADRVQAWVDKAYKKIVRQKREIEKLQGQVVELTGEIVDYQFQVANLESAAANATEHGPDQISTSSSGAPAASRAIAPAHVKHDVRDVLQNIEHDVRDVLQNIEHDVREVLRRVEHDVRDVLRRVEHDFSVAQRVFAEQPRGFQQGPLWPLGRSALSDLEIPISRSTRTPSSSVSATSSGVVHKVKQQEMQILQHFNQQVMQVQHQTAARKTALEQRAMQLTMEFQQKKGGLKMIRFHPLHPWHDKRAFNSLHAWHDKRVFNSLHPWHDKRTFNHFEAPEDQEMMKWVKEFHKFDLYSKGDVLQKNDCTIPECGLKTIRFHSLFPWHDKRTFNHFEAPEDQEMMKWVKEFNKFDLYSKGDVLQKNDCTIPECGLKMITFNSLHPWHDKRTFNSLHPWHDKRTFNSLHPWHDKRTFNSLHPWHDKRTFNPLYPWHDKRAFNHFEAPEDQEMMKCVKEFHKFDLYSKGDVLQKNDCTIPECGLKMIGFHSLFPWHDKCAFNHFAAPEDQEMMTWVKEFHKFDLYSKGDVLQKNDCTIPECGLKMIGFNSLYPWHDMRAFNSLYPWHDSVQLLCQN